MFDREFPQAEWIIVRRKREGFVKSCIKTSFMAQHSKDPKFWRNVADEYDLRLDELKKTVSNVYELQTEDILSGDTAALKSMVMLPRCENSSIHSIGITPNCAFVCLLGQTVD